MGEAIVSSLWLLKHLQYSWSCLKKSRCWRFNLRFNFKGTPMLSKNKQRGKREPSLGSVCLGRMLHYAVVPSFYRWTNWNHREKGPAPNLQVSGKIGTTTQISWFPTTHCSANYIPCPYMSFSCIHQYCLLLYYQIVSRKSWSSDYFIGLSWLKVSYFLAENSFNK